MTRSHSDLPLALCAAFVVALGYGTVLPLLPRFIQRLEAVATPDAVAFQTALLTGVYTLALFFSAPFWGRLSDRTGHRKVLLIGLTGFALTIVGFGQVNHLGTAYAMRAGAGSFGGAVLALSMAVAGSDILQHRRARHIDWVSAATTLGFLAGPALGGWLPMPRPP
ncbi:MFS transporter [Marinobacteraceae bacterium S3BR75-40.1]